MNIPYNSAISLHQINSPHVYKEKQDSRIAHKGKNLTQIQQIKQKKSNLLN